MPDESFNDFVMDQLHSLGGVEPRSMFGGRGLYKDGIFFAIVYKGRLYFKTDAESGEEYKSRGMHPFRPSAQQTLKSYYEVPADVLEDGELLSQWARRAVRAQDKTRRPG